MAWIWVAPIFAVQFKSSDDCDEIRKKFDRYAHNYEIFLQNMLYTLRSVDDYCVDMAIAEELLRSYWSEYHHKKFQNFVESNIWKEEIRLPRAWKFFLGKLKKIKRASQRNSFLCIKWCNRQDSNLWPPPSQGGVLIQLNYDCRCNEYNDFFKKSSFFMNFVAFRKNQIISHQS